MIDRRSILRGALAGAGLAALPRNTLAAAAAGSRAGQPLVFPQILFIFLRGGADGLNFVAPVLDPGYYTHRPTLAIPAASALTIQGATFAKLNPDLARLVPIDQAGHLASAHAFGSLDVSLSHFTAMAMCETASLWPISQASLATKNGFVPRLLQTMGVPVLANGEPAALSVSLLMQRMFRAGSSTQLSAHVRDLTASQLALPFPMADIGVPQALAAQGVAHFATPVNALDQQFGANLAFGVTANDTLKNLGFAAQFGTTGLFPVTPADLTALGSHPDAAVLPTYDPKGASFAASAEQALYALRNVPNLRVAGVEFGGWDTHGNQGLLFPNLVRYLGWVLADLYAAIAAAGLLSTLRVVVFSEFGRTVKENSSQGTDHGSGGAMFCIGNGVTPGTHNVHGGTPGPNEHGVAWTPVNPAVQDYVSVNAGVRDVLAELFTNHMGVPLASLASILDGYPASSAAFPGIN